MEVPLASLTFNLPATSAHGMIAKTGERSFRYTPNAGYVGSDSFSFTVSGGVTRSAPATISITVNARTLAAVASDSVISFSLVDDEVIAASIPSIPTTDRQSTTVSDPLWRSLSR